MKKIILIFLLLASQALSVAIASNGFVVKKIEVQGLQGITASTVYHYLPIKPGHMVKPGDTAKILKALYSTGFFDHASLARQGNTLVITVVERPVIGRLNITGNSVIPKDKLTTVMDNVHIAEGKIYDQGVLDQIKQSLLNEYYLLGRFNARVDVTVSSMPRNRVQVNIAISEGLVARVQGIDIVGNHAFSDRTLTSTLTLSTPGLLTFFTQTDRFSQEKLDSSRDALTHFYLDHGYVRFAIKSAQARVASDRKSVFVTFVVSEGAPYTIKHIALSGNLILPSVELMKRVQLKPGDVFSRQSLMDSNKAIVNALGDKGYLGAGVGVAPVVDDALKQVSLTLKVAPGRLTYVRHIYFSDNNRTNDKTLRRNVTQMESALASSSNLEDSKWRLNRLGYIKDVQMTILPVPAEHNKVDVNYKVKEDNAAQIQARLGYSILDHAIIGLSFTQQNFLGTGNTLAMNAEHSRYKTDYSISYMNPYFTQDGVSRTISLSLYQFNPKYANLGASYTMDQYSLSDVYGLPVGQMLGVVNTLKLGYGYDNTAIMLNQNVNTSQQVKDFVGEHGTRFGQLDLITGFSRDTRNKGIFPTSGTLNELNANFYVPAARGGLAYYTVGYGGTWYYPLTDSFVFVTRGNFAYGSSLNNGGAKNYPFFRNFYTGGLAANLPGYAGNSLGPKDSNGQASGGNMLATANAGLIFPNFASDSLRTMLFVAGGNVFNTFNAASYGGTNAGYVRLSAGLEADWSSPLGVIDISLAKPLNPKKGPLPDDEQIFDFSIGARI